MSNLRKYPISEGVSGRSTRVVEETVRGTELMKLQRSLCDRLGSVYLGKSKAVMYRNTLLVDVSKKEKSLQQRNIPLGDAAVVKR